MSVAESLHGFGGFLRCEECGYRPFVALTDADTTHYLANGWPRHCGYTMRWWTQRQIDANEVPDWIAKTRLGEV